MSDLRRFVILTHDHPVLHWDLMIEVEDVLRTWRLERAPQTGVEIAAVAIADHRRSYLDYEGPVSGDRGTVTRWDAGTYESLDETADQITVVLSGQRVSGLIALTRVRDGGDWVFELHPAEPMES